MEQGKVSWFNDDKGFGFIKLADESQKDVFVHYSAIEGRGRRTLHDGQEVEVEWEQGPKGPVATRVVKLPGGTDA